MKLLSTLVLIGAGLAADAQTIIPNGGFETWGGNPSPGVATEPNGWYSNLSGSTIASAGPQTCFQDNSIVHSGSASVRVETISFLTTAVNGNVTTGVVNAPSLSKADGYIGTRNYTDTATDIRRTAFTGHPDSLIGWYQYTSGGTGEMGKIRCILHTGDYYDPETPTTYHPDCTANKVGEALFNTPTGNTSTWTRFSIPFTYVSGAGSPAYIMVNITSSANQTTTVSGSKLWIDDLAVVYNSSGVQPLSVNNDVHVYAVGKTVYAATAPSAQGAKLIIFDMTGRMVVDATTQPGTTNSYDLSAFPTGTYVYRSGNVISTTGKLILQ